MRRIYLSLLMLISSVYASAYDIEINGLYFSYINEGKELEFDSCKSDITTLIIPDEVTYHDRSRSVTAIGNGACKEDSSIIAVAIPNTVRSIGDAAFQRATGITSLNIPSSVQTIGTFAFSGCKGLKTVLFGSGVRKIGEFAFMYCTGLTKLELPVNLESLGHDAFNYCLNVEEIDIRSGNINKLYGMPKVKKLTIGKKVTALGTLEDFLKEDSRKYLEELRIEDLYSWCNIVLKNPLPIHEAGQSQKTAIYVGSKLVSNLVIPDGVTRINKAIFNNWPITGVVIPNSVTEIEQGAFANNHQLAKVVIGNGVTRIPDNCFDNSLVNSIQMSTNVKEIGVRAFYGNTFPTITLPNTLRRIGRMAFNKTKLTSITVPNSVKFIGAGAFAECSDMVKAEINCDTVDVCAFKNCKSLKNLTLGNSVKYFASTAIDPDPKYNPNVADGQIFAGSPLSVIISYIENPFSFPENIFEKDTYYNASLLIPGGTMNRYKSTDYWSKFIFVEGIGSKN